VSAKAGSVDPNCLARSPEETNTHLQAVAAAASRAVAQLAYGIKEEVFEFVFCRIPDQAG
jgi:hypothetical protein